jgi:HlyD family secretion protein
MSTSVTGVGRFTRTIRTFSVLAISLAIVAGCSSEASNQAAEPESTEKVINTVKASPIAKLQIAAPMEQVADVIASAQVDIISKATADVLEVMKQRGAVIEKGDVVVKLDDTDVRMQHEQAQLGYESAQQSLSAGRKEWQHSVTQMEQLLHEATKVYNKMRNDYDSGVVGQTELDQAENAYTNAKNDLAILKERSVSGLELQVRSAEVSLELSSRSLTYYEIKAPISGILTEIPVQQGMTLNQGFQVGRIQQLDPIKVKALLTAQSTELIRGKQQLAFYIPGQDKVYTAPVTYLSDVVDSQTNAYELNLSIANPGLVLKPGMKVQVLLTNEAEQQVVAVPTLSIVREGADNYVYVLVGDRAEKRKVVLGRLNELNQEIISGVKEGEMLIVSGQHQLNDGDQVKVEKSE